jgi:ribokinase
MEKMLVVGSLNMDLVAIAPRIPVVGKRSSAYFTAPGGKGANQAYAAALLGGQVAMLGRMGDDEFGRQMRANLERAGCDSGGLGVELGPSGVALIFSRHPHA